MKRSTAFLLIAVSAAGCQQKMANQPSYRPLEPSGFFPDGMSARPLPRGVVAREWPATKDPIVSGLKPDARPRTVPPNGNPAAKSNTPRAVLQAIPISLSTNSPLNSRART